MPYLGEGGLLGRPESNWTFKNSIQKIFQRLFIYLFFSLCVDSDFQMSLILRRGVENRAKKDSRLLKKEGNFDCFFGRGRSPTP